MNVETMTMTRDQASRALRQYRDRSRKKVSAEFDEIEQAYAQLAKGTPLLDVASAIAAAPRDAKKRPMLAIARADRRQVEYHCNGGDERFRDVDSPRWTATLNLAFPRSENSPEQWLSGYALVPLVPPPHSNGRDLSKYFTLWQVEQWAERRIGSRADRDPYLLKRLGTTNLFAVLAEWDLTDVERAVMQAHRVTR